MPASTHLIILPTYNTGPRLAPVVAEALGYGYPVLVVVDGSTDGSEIPVVEMAKEHPLLTVRRLPQNSGKGAAVLAGARAAVEEGYTHALVMDSDGQHPAASIPEFMEESRANPEALVLGHPIFPANIPSARLHGRKLSVWMVHLEILGAGIDDPLFGFRVIPLRPLLEVLGPRSGGRRYDFDTESAVRLVWSGVPTRNLRAPVRYFSREEGGVSHFRYVRDNVTQVWLHTRLVTELLLLRWPSVIRHRRHWRKAAHRSAATVTTVVLVAASLSLLSTLRSAPEASESETAADRAMHQRVDPRSAEWRELAGRFSKQPDVTADFIERRVFPFRKTPLELRGEVRVSPARGLSLHYLGNDEHTVILDDKGMLLRGKAGEKAPPADPRAAAANEAMRHILRFDFEALEKDFDLYGFREVDIWTLALVPRTDDLKRSIGRIIVAGTGAEVRNIEIRRSARQYILIDIAPPRSTTDFTQEDLERYFR